MPGLRIDKLLWFLRIARTRPLAQQWAETGHIRLNGRRVDRAHLPVAVGDRLVIPVGAHVHVIEIIALPEHRGPAIEARACYRVLDDPAPTPLARPQIKET